MCYRRKKLKIARFLLKHGVNPNESYEDGWTALHVAVTVGHDSTPVEFSSTIGDVALARCLLEHGADSTAINADGEMPLHYAMQVGNIEMAELLIPRMGDKCDKGDRSGNTPLNLAVQQGHQQVALFLLDHGANPLAVGPRGRTPLHEAARQGNLDLLKRLSNAVPPLTLVQPDADGNTPLHLAVCNYSVKDRSWESDNIAVVEWLLSVARADPNIPDEIGYTPLHEAASQGLAKIMKILLRNGADPKRRDREGRVPLHVSAEHGDVETAKILFEGTGGLNLRDKEGMTPLLLSVYSRHSRILKMVKELLLLSADPTETDIQGNTPLHLTVPFSGADMRADCDEQKKGFIAVDIAELLLKNGAEIDARNKEGMTSLQVAMQMGMGMGMGMGMKIDYYSVRNNALIACFLQHGESIGRDFARPGFTGLLTLCPTVLENAVVIGAKFPVDYRPPASAITTPAEFFARVWTAQQYLTFVVMTDKACQADPANTVLAEFHRALLMKMQTHSLKLAASMVVGNRREVRTLVAGEMSYFYSTGKMRESKHCCPKELYPLLFAHPKMRAEVERAKAARAPVVEMEDEAAGGGGGAGRTRGDDVRDAAVAGDEVRAPRAASDAAGKEAEIEEDDEIQVGEPALTPPQSPSGEPGSHQLREKHLLRNIAILLEFSDPRSVGVEEIIDAFIKLAPNTRRMMLFTKADKDSDALGKLKIVLNLDDDSTPDNIFEAARRFIERSRSAAAGSDVESGDASLAQGALSDGGEGLLLLRRHVELLDLTS